MDKLDYRALCESTFISSWTKDMVVYTGDVVNFLPVFKVVHPVLASAFYLGKERKELWGIVAVDTVNHTTEWHNYNDCVSLEDWQVLLRMLDARFGWIKRVDGLREEIIANAKSLLR